MEFVYVNHFVGAQIAEFEVCVNVEQMEEFHEVLEALRDPIICHHHSNVSVEAMEKDGGLQRVIFIGLAALHVRLLEAVVPLDQVPSLVHHLPCCTMSVQVQHSS